MSRSELIASRWLEAHSDGGAGLTTFPGSLTLADVAGDGDHRLVLIDLKLDPDVRSRLKVYKGTVLTSDQVLTDIPCGLVSFYTDNFEPRIPAVAVACGPDLLIYKNNKPFFKFSTPQFPITPLEKEVWNKLNHNQNQDIIKKSMEELKTMQFNTLSTKSQYLLTLQNDSEIASFIQKHAATEPTKLQTITCVATLNRNLKDKNSVACPIVATEDGNIYILDPLSFSIIHEARTSNCKATPWLMATTGCVDVEFRILLACRENVVCLLRRTWLEGKILLQTTQNIVDMVLVPGDNFIILGTSDQMLHCYTKRGNILWSSKLVHPMTCICLVPLEHLSLSLIAVGLKGGFVHLYKGRNPVDFMSVPDTPFAITFGQLGQEDHVMVIITTGGSINFKILKRTADFTVSNQDIDSSPLYQNKPLPLPKRSKLFLEQSMKERQNAIEIHRNFQEDLVRLRLLAARATVANLADQTGIGNEKEQIKMCAQVLGLGPKFTLILTLENMNTSKALTGLTIIFHSRKLFNLSSYVIKVPLIAPRLSFKTTVKVSEEVKEVTEVTSEIEDTERMIRVFVTRESQSVPILAAAIKMPLTEFFM